MTRSTYQVEAFRQQAAPQHGGHGHHQPLLVLGHERCADATGDRDAQQLDERRAGARREEALSQVRVGVSGETVRLTVVYKERVFESQDGQSRSFRQARVVG